MTGPIARLDADLTACRRLVDGGYTLAVDDFHAVDGLEDLLELASIVKIDPEAVGRERAR